MFPSIHLFFHLIFGVCFSSNRAYCVIWGHEEANRYPKLNWSQLFLVWYFPLPFPFLVFFVFVNLFSTWNIWLEKFGFCCLCREKDVRKRPKETNKQIRTSKFWDVFEKSLLQYVNPLFSNFASFFFPFQSFFLILFCNVFFSHFLPFLKVMKLIFCLEWDGYRQSSNLLISYLWIGHQRSFVTISDHKTNSHHPLFSLHICRPYWLFIWNWILFARQLYLFAKYLFGHLW